MTTPAARCTKPVHAYCDRRTKHRFGRCSYCGGPTKTIEYSFAVLDANWCYVAIYDNETDANRYVGPKPGHRVHLVAL